MSFFNIGMTLRSTLLLKSLADEWSTHPQDLIQEAERAGREVLEAETPRGSTLQLSSSIESGENQSAVWFKVAGIINGRPYGYAMEYGWHDRGGHWHEGVHMLEHAAAEAERVYRAFAGDFFGSAIFKGGAGGRPEAYPDVGFGRVGIPGRRGFSGTYVP